MNTPAAHATRRTEVIAHGLLKRLWRDPSAWLRMRLSIAETLVMEQLVRDGRVQRDGGRYRLPQR